MWRVKIKKEGESPLFTIFTIYEKYVKKKKYSKHSMKRAIMHN